MNKQIAAAFAMLAALGASASAQEEMPYGEAEFLNSCAACHGERGMGDGPLASVLTTPPADLTRLSEGNKGAFPYYRVFSLIDGRYLVPGHGEREMPVWGQQFVEEDAKTYGPNGGELITTERIHELTSFIETLQR